MLGFSDGKLIKRFDAASFDTRHDTAGLRTQEYSKSLRHRWTQCWEHRAHWLRRPVPRRARFKVRPLHASYTPSERFTADKDTVALYNFDEGSGDTLKDSSGNKHHGKIIGAKWVRVGEPTTSAYIADYALRFQNRMIRSKRRIQ